MKTLVRSKAGKKVHKAAVKHANTRATTNAHRTGGNAPDAQPQADGVSMVLVPLQLEKETMDEMIAFRLPSKWKANIEKRLAALGVPKSRFSEFYRGAIIAGIGNSMRAKSPEWQEFLRVVQPIAKEKLGADLTDAGLEALIRQGVVLPGTPS
jgi:hypothetical protein